MYATANEYLGMYKVPQTNLTKESYIPHSTHTTISENYRDVRHLGLDSVENYADRSHEPYTRMQINRERTREPRESRDTQNSREPIHETKSANLVWEDKVVKNTADPKIWGPAFWFTLHNSAVHYPINASPIVRERMKGRILAIPYEIPCAGCQPHASAFVEKHKDKLDEIVSGRHSLGKFYVDFHNLVNRRYGKKEWTYDEAYATYSGKTKVSYMKY